MREATKVFTEASSLTTTEQPLAFSTSLMTVRVTSRRVIEFSCNRAHGEPEIKPACPVFSFHAAGLSIDNLFRYPRTAPNIFAVKSQLVHLESRLRPDPDL